MCWATELRSRIERGPGPASPARPTAQSFRSCNQQPRVGRADIWRECRGRATIRAACRVGCSGAALPPCCLSLLLAASAAQPACLLRCRESLLLHFCLSSLLLPQPSAFPCCLSSQVVGFRHQVLAFLTAAAAPCWLSSLLLPSACWLSSLLLPSACLLLHELEI